MKSSDVKKYVNKKVYLILKNNFRYTTIIPNFEGETFSIIDKFGHVLHLDCDLIGFIQEVPEDDSN